MSFRNEGGDLSIEQIPYPGFHTTSKISAPALRAHPPPPLPQRAELTWELLSERLADQYLHLEHLRATLAACHDDAASSGWLSCLRLVVRLERLATRGNFLETKGPVFGFLTKRAVLAITCPHCSFFFLRPRNIKSHSFPSARVALQGELLGGSFGTGEHVSKAALFLSGNHPVLRTPDFWQAKTSITSRS